MQLCSAIILAQLQKAGITLGFYVGGPEGQTGLDPGFQVRGGRT